MYLYVFMYTSVDMHKNSKKGTFFLVKSIRRIQMHMDEKKEKNLKYVQVLMHFFSCKNTYNK